MTIYSGFSIVMLVYLQLIEHVDLSIDT
jgi:hypothetical protein